MKCFFTLLLSIPLFALAQNCKLNKVIDQFSREPKLTTGLIPLSTASLSINATSTDIDFFFAVTNASSAKCFDDASTASLTFDGTRSKANFKNTGTMNCDGYFHFTFKNTATTAYALQRLTTQKVNTITLNGSNKGVLVITLSDDQKQVLMDAATCIANEAKTLIKQP